MKHCPIIVALTHLFPPAKLPWDGEIERICGCEAAVVAHTTAQATKTGIHDAMRISMRHRCTMIPEAAMPGAAAGMPSATCSGRSLSAQCGYSGMGYEPLVISRSMMLCIGLSWLFGH